MNFAWSSPTLLNNFTDFGHIFQQPQLNFLVWLKQTYKPDPNFGARIWARPILPAPTAERLPLPIAILPLKPDQSKSTRSNDYNNSFWRIYWGCCAEHFPVIDWVSTLAGRFTPILPEEMTAPFSISTTKLFLVTSH